MNELKAEEFARCTLAPQTIDDFRNGGLPTRLVFPDGYVVEGHFRHRVLFGDIERHCRGLAGVYALVDPTSGCCYFGSSIDLSRRRNDHKKHLRDGDHPSNLMQKAFAENDGLLLMRFNYFIPRDDSSLGAIRDLEQRFLDLHRGAVFLANTALDSRARQTGIPISDYHRQRIRETNAVRTVTEETRLLMSSKSKGHKRRVGKVHSEETKRRMSEIAKLRPPRPGIPHTAETRAKLSAARRKPLLIEGVEYSCMNDAIAGTGMKECMIRNRVRSTDAEYQNYQYKDISNGW